MCTSADSFTVIVNRNKLGVVVHRAFFRDAVPKSLYLQWDILGTVSFEMTSIEWDDENPPFNVDRSSLVSKDLGQEFDPNSWTIYRSEVLSDSTLNLVRPAQESPATFVRDSRKLAHTQSIRLSQSQEHLAYTEGMGWNLPDNRPEYMLSKGAEKENTDGDGAIYLEHEISFFQSLLERELRVEDPNVRVRIKEVGVWKDGGKSLISGAIQFSEALDTMSSSKSELVRSKLGGYAGTHKTAITYV